MNQLLITSIVGETLLSITRIDYLKYLRLTFASKGCIGVYIILLKGVNPHTFEELAIRDRDRELNIVVHGDPRSRDA